MKIWLKGAKITVSWQGGRGSHSRTFRIESTDQIRNVKVQIEYTAEGQHTVTVPVEVDDNLMAKAFGAVFGP